MHFDSRSWSLHHRGARLRQTSRPREQEQDEPSLVSAWAHRHNQILSPFVRRCRMPYVSTNVLLKHQECRCEPQRETLLANLREVARIEESEIALESALVNDLLVSLLVVRRSEENVVLRAVNSSVRRADIRAAHLDRHGLQSQHQHWGRTSHCARLTWIQDSCWLCDRSAQDDERELDDRTSTPCRPSAVSSPTHRDRMEYSASRPKALVRYQPRQCNDVKQPLTVQEGGLAAAGRPDDEVDAVSLEDQIVFDPQPERLARRRESTVCSAFLGPGEGSLRDADILLMKRRSIVDNVRVGVPIQQLGLCDTSAAMSSIMAREPTSFRKSLIRPTETLP
jgi:hypothetical protein